MSVFHALLCFTVIFTCGYLMVAYITNTVKYNKYEEDKKDGKKE